MHQQDGSLDQLIDRIKNEALDKAKSEAQAIMLEAEHKAQAIIDQASKTAKALLDDSRAHVEREKLIMRTELELAARDFSLKFAERLSDQLLFPIMKQQVRATLKEPSFLKEVLQKIMATLAVENPCSIDILIPKEQKTTLAAFFAAAVFDALDKKIDWRLIDEDGIEGFVLMKRDEQYVWDFRAETVSRELIRLIEPSLRKYFLPHSKNNAPEIKSFEGTFV